MHAEINAIQSRKRFIGLIEGDTGFVPRCGRSGNSVSSRCAAHLQQHPLSKEHCPIKWNIKQETER